MLQVKQKTYDRPAPSGEVPSPTNATSRFAEPNIDPGQPVVALIQASLSAGLLGLMSNETAALAGDEEGVHRLRTSSRRLRSLLALFRSLLDEAWVERLGAELKWLGQCLGSVRDLDVLQRRLVRDAQEVHSLSTIEPLLETLKPRHEAARHALTEALSSDRFRTLLVELVRATVELPARDRAFRPCREELPRVVNRVWKRLRSPARKLRPNDPDEHFHDVRKRAKQARYAAEAARPGLGPRMRVQAERFANRARRVQDTLGEHQDAVVTSGVIREAIEAHPELRDHQAGLDRLLERELKAAEDSRRRFFDVWPALDRDRVTRWLSR